jgi:uncharacterized membrane protein YhaH (DUF805 family)
MAGDPIALATVVVIAAVLALLVILLTLGERRWRAAGLDIDGQQRQQKFLTDECWWLDIYALITRSGLGRNDLGLLSST